MIITISRQLLERATKGPSGALQIIVHPQADGSLELAIPVEPEANDEAELKRIREQQQEAVAAGDDDKLRELRDQERQYTEQVFHALPPGSTIA
jgi:hypothetical protein